MKVENMFLVVIFSLACTLVKGQPRQDCQTSCGNVTIEYPFGTSPGCYYPDDPSFNLTCNGTNKMFVDGMEVISISRNGQLRILFPVSDVCYNDKVIFTSGGKANIKHRAKPKLTSSRFNIVGLGNFSLSTNNSITGVGCTSFAYLRGLQTRIQTIGCVSGCGIIPENGTCSGEGCCQIPISKNISSIFYVSAKRFEGQSNDFENFNRCSYAFLVETGKFSFFASEDLKNLRNVTKFPVVLDWSIGRQTCKQVGNRSICGGNSTCFDSIRGEGYICKCKDGYNGNPHLPNGCKDIDECTDLTHTHNCGNAKFCRNKEGSFECNCPSSYRLVPVKGCTRKEFVWTPVILGTTIGFLVLMLGVCGIQQRLKHRKDTKLRQHFFEKNGGSMLIQRLAGAGFANVDVKIFTEKDMKEATDGYDKDRILGEGGQGTVYKGFLPDNSIVAIKKARLGDCSQVEQFINEVLVLSQINHRNVVKLLGCCLETEVPLLVYEFITSGTLFDHLHGSLFDSSLTWEHRLRIAIEVAGTLAYLHSSASIPIIHRDVKTANILLDENLTAKVADFGASRLIPMDKEQLTTMVQGTLGYLDPEYYNTGLLNEKSDVYSFGVVLMELLSGQKALCFERPQCSKHLVSYFASANKENRLHDIIDGQLINEDNQREIHEAASVAVKCTRLMGEERPRMKEVAVELETLRVAKTKHRWSDQYQEPEEIESLLGVKILAAQGDTGSSGYDNMKNVPELEIEAGN